MTEDLKHLGIIYFHPSHSAVYECEGCFRVELGPVFTLKDVYDAEMKHREKIEDD